MAGGTNCPICGVLVTTKQNKYCSRECQWESMRGKARSTKAVAKQSSTLRKKSKLYRYSREYYDVLYNTMKMSSYSIAKLLNTHPSSIYAHLKRIGIEIRTQKKSIKYRLTDPRRRFGTYISGGYVKHRGDIHRLVHREIVRRVIGRELRPNEVIHHIDGDGTNNEQTNLLVCTRSYHTYIHRMMDIKNNKPLFGGRT